MIGELKPYCTDCVKSHKMIGSYYDTDRVTVKEWFDKELYR